MSDGDAEPLPAPRETMAWLAGWFAICIGCLFGPHYSEGILWPATLVIVAGALPYVYWLCQQRTIRLAVIAIAIGVHAVAWAYGLVVMHGIHDEFADRLARLTRTPAGEVAAIAPYSQLRPGAWFYGEDWDGIDRELVAISLFGLRDIAFDTSIRPEANPDVAVHLEQTGLSADDLAAWGPAMWGRAPATARIQLAALAKRAARAGRSAELTLVVDGLTFPALRGRPIELATAAHGKLTSPEIAHASAVDPNDRYRLAATPAFAASHPETYLLRDGRATPTAYDQGAYWVSSVTGGSCAVISCEPTRCLLLDAFVPRR